MSVKIYERLPIESHANDIINLVQQQPRVILSSPAGSGKTTRVPLMLQPHFKGKTLMLQPRRVAARSVAHWMAELAQEPIGQFIGYHVRFERKCTKETKIEVLTEGILIQRILQDPELDGISCIILDEFHERHLASDLIFAMLRELQEAWRPDLKIIIMSATLDANVLAQMTNAHVYTIQVRQFPIQIHYQKGVSSQSPCVDAIDCILHAWHNHCKPYLLPKSLNTTLATPYLSSETNLSSKNIGHLLAFFPGKAEIIQAQRSLKNRYPDLIVDLLMGSLSLAEQSHVLRPNSPARVILATNIAETSLTIPGVIVVVDTGLVKVNHFDFQQGVNVLTTQKIAQDASQQRAGRAGRTQAGFCYRLWSEVDQKRKDPHTVAEIHRTDLSTALLQVASWAGDWRSFEWLEPPQTTQVQYARTYLHDLRALEDDKLTDLGQQLLKIPLAMNTTMALLYAYALDCLDDTIHILAFLEIQHNLIGKSHTVSSDSSMSKQEYDQPQEYHIIEQLYYYKQWKSNKKTPSSFKNHIAQRLDHMIRLLSRYTQRMISDAPHLINTLEHAHHLEQWNVDPHNTQMQKVGIAMAWSHSGWVAQRRSHVRHRALLALGTEIHCPHHVMEESDYIVCLQVISYQGRLQTRHILPVSLVHLMPGAQVHQDYELNEDTQRVYVVHSQCWQSLKLKIKRHAATTEDKQAQLIFARYIAAQPKERLPLNQACLDWLIRVRFVGQYLAKIPNHDFDTSSWPTYKALDRMSNESSVPEVLKNLCYGHVSMHSFRKVDFLGLLKGLCPSSITQFVSRMAPTHYILPTGQKKQIHYHLDEPPFIEAYLQAWLGENKHPMLAECIPLQLRLLAPNQRVIQTTSDLPHFWQNAYHLVRKELRGRYPKHFWPKDPLSMGAQSRSKPRHIAQTQTQTKAQIKAQIKAQTKTKAKAQKKM